MPVIYNFNNGKVGGGLIIDEDQEYLWEDVFPNKSQDEFYQELTKGLPKGMDVFIDIDEDEEELGSIIYSKGEGEISYSFLFREGKVELFGAFVDEKYPGASKQILRNMFDVIKENKIEDIELNAIIMGSYVWSKLGFVPDVAAWNDRAKPQIESRLDDYKEAISETGSLEDIQAIEDMRSALSDDPKSIWQVVDNKTTFPLSPKLSLGKAALFPADELSKKFNSLSDINFKARFSFADKDCVKRAGEYLGLS